jgi:hypothetical protein
MKAAIRAAFFLLLCVCLLSSPAPASDDYQTVAQNFLQYRQGTREIIAAEIIERNELDPSLPKVVVASLFHLKGGGYILVAASGELTPIKAYSFESNFSTLPDPYRRFVLLEMETNIRNLQATRGTMAINPAASENRKRWDFLLGALPMRTPQEYLPDTVLLTTRWNQGEPYNKFLPEIDNQHTLTGCVNTAVAQVLRYHRHPQRGTGVVTYPWNSQTLKAIFYRTFNWDNMPDSLSGATPVYQVDEVALLMRDLAIANYTSFGVDASPAGVNASVLVQDLSYSNQATSMTNTNMNLFFATIKAEIDALRPVFLIFPGHMTVADGYSSDPSGRKIHVNMGWGGHSDDYYYLDQAVQAGGYTFPTNPPNLTIYYNIKPCSGSDCVLAPIDTGPDVAPVINNAFNDILLSPASGSPYRILVDARDENGDTLTLSVANTNAEAVSAQLSGNILELTHLTSTKVASKITVRAQANGQTAEKSFIVLLSDEEVSFGREFELRGVFANQYDYDKHKVILDGSCTMKGYRGYSNQAFYTSVMNLVEQAVVPMNDVEIQGTFARNTYLIGASLEQNPGGFGSYYGYQQGQNDAYSITISCPSADASISTVAQLLGINLSGTEDNSGLTNLSLGAGWNFISLPKQPQNPAIETVLAEVLSKVRVVWGFNNESKDWQRYRPSVDLTLASMEQGKGYWAYMDEAATIAMAGWASPATTIHLYAGWNLVGFSGTDGTMNGITLPGSGTDGAWDIIWTWDNGTWSASHATIPSLPLPAIDALEQGKAYWILVDEGSPGADWVQ